MTPWMYAGLFTLLAYGWPLLFYSGVDNQSQQSFWLIFVVNTIVALLVYNYNGSPELSFFKGLQIISGSLMSGCANITMLYLPFVLVVVYLGALFNTLLGLINGRKHTQESWAKTVIGFYERRNKK